MKARLNEILILVLLAAALSCRGIDLSELEEAIDTENLSKIAAFIAGEPPARHNNVDSQGNTICHLAAESGKQKVLALLATLGVELNQTNRAGLTPTHLALLNGHKESALLLIDRGVAPDFYSAAALGDIRTLARLNQTQSLKPVPSLRGMPLLHWATLSDESNILQFLIEQGIDLSSVGESGETALHFAAYSDRITSVAALLKNKVKINAQDKAGATPLVWAVRGGNRSIVQLLLESGADANLTARGRPSAIYQAAALGYADIVELLAPHVKLIDKSNATLVSVVGGHTKTLEVLLASGIDANLKFHGKPLLEYASEGDSVASLKLLLAHGAKIDSVNDSGGTALHAAARSGKLAIIDMLLKSGASRKVRDANGETPEELARLCGNSKAADALATFK